MARQSLSPMKSLSDVRYGSAERSVRSVGRKRKDAPMTHLKYLRKRSGYTLETLSEITSISVSYLSRLESGARRLNTDLIRRLSHAFGCDPAELLQEISHESQVVTPVEFNKKRRNDILLGEYNLHFYRIAEDRNDPSSRLCMELCSSSELRQRPSELAGRNDVFAMKAESYFEPHFSSSSTLYLEPPTNLTPESMIIIIEGKSVMLKRIWSITPTTLQVCDMNSIEQLKSGAMPKDNLLNVERNNDVSIYKVVGYSDFDLN